MLRRFGFGSNWIRWMRACVFAGSPSVLVNGSPTQEVNIKRGLEQGDPLAPFLFLLVAEGIGLLMHKAVYLHFFKPICVNNSNVSISHLQYADDTIFIGEDCVENLWCMKAILRCVEENCGHTKKLLVGWSARGEENCLGEMVGEDLVAQLETFISGAPIRLVDDSWSCTIGDDGQYAVKEGYSFLSENFLPELEVSANLSRVLKNQWYSVVPSKVIVFSWQLIRQRLPARDNLSRRGVPGLMKNSSCVWCPEERETEMHLFGSCRVALEVWAEIYKWIGIQSVHSSDLCSSFESFGFPFNICKKRRKGLCLIWHTVIWSLWKARNACIFDGKELSIHHLVETNKHVSLKWLIARGIPFV
ncbi:hypothetical protein TSUD_296800 [Trifolium subterraneum]|uniref:Reverse transcriptase domain-containing protein n=1 Tax=Trifolium subterraneum TaxID=3900 RepID=A0A2Z6NS27_TRISU|nr:hypothetical protein TSUD_296800 [Trifolium subterraneum]